jgi:enolase-phosphatase E1
MSEPSVRLYLLDIEGTVAPLSLVTEQLFPYARAHFTEFLRERGSDADVLADLKLLAEENRVDAEPGAPRLPSFGQSGRSEPAARPEAALNYLLWLMDRDRKSTALKSLQGTIWKAGFENGRLKGTLFADVPAALKRWSDSARVAIYSSGSVEAQQLLFRYSSFGDLTPLISGYFDTRTGPKTESASYAAIAKAMDVAPGDAVFFSDVVKELDPARTAGMQTRLVVREGNAVVEDARGHWRVESLSSD